MVKYQFKINKTSMHTSPFFMFVKVRPGSGWAYLAHAGKYSMVARETLEEHPDLISQALEWLARQNTPAKQRFQEILLSHL